ncbi:hypothetical protein D3C86_1689370 [compost metagenome]
MLRSILDCVCLGAVQGEQVHNAVVLERSDVQLGRRVLRHWLNELCHVSQGSRIEFLCLLRLGPPEKHACHRLQMVCEIMDDVVLLDQRKNHRRKSAERRNNAPLTNFFDV